MKINTLLEETTAGFEKKYGLDLTSLTDEYSYDICSSVAEKISGAKVISLGFNNEPTEIEKDLLGDIDHSLKVDGFSHTAIMYQNRFFDPQSTRGVETLGQLKKVMAYNNYPKESHIYLPYSAFMDAGDQSITEQLASHSSEKGIFKTSKSINFKNSTYIVYGGSSGPGYVGKHRLLKVVPKELFNGKSYINRDPHDFPAEMTDYYVDDNNIVQWRYSLIGLELELNNECCVVAEEVCGEGLLPSGVFSMTTNDARDQYVEDNPGESSAGDVELIEVSGLWMTRYANGFLLKLPGRRFNQVFFKTREQADELVKVYNSNSYDNLHRDVTTANQLALQL